MTATAPDPHPQRLLEQLQAANAIVESLSVCRDPVTRELQVQDNPEEIARLLAQGLVERLELASALVWFYDPAGGALHLKAQAGLISPAQAALRTLAPDKTPLGELVRDRAPKLSNQLHREPWIQSPDWIEAENLVGFASYPIYWGSQLAGCVAVFSRQPLAPTFLEVLQFICTHTASALAAARQSFQLRQQAERQALLYRIIDSIRASLNLDDILQAAVEAIGQALQACRVQFLYCDPHAEQLVYRHAFAQPYVDSWLGRPAADREQVLAKALLQQNQRIALQVWLSLDEMDAENAQLLHDAGVQSLMLVGLNLGQSYYGILSVHRCRLDYVQELQLQASERADSPEEGGIPCDWTDSDCQLLKAVAEQLAIAITQSHLYAKTEQQARREALLNEISADIRNSLDPNQVLKSIEVALATALELEDCHIQLYRDMMVFPAREEGDRDPSDIQIYDTLANGYPVLLKVGDLDRIRPAECQFFQLQLANSTALLPLVQDGELLGTIVLVARRSEQSFAPEKFSLAIAVAEQAGIALKQAQLHQQTRRLARRETLLRQLAQRLTGTHQVQEIIAIALEGCADALHLDCCDFITLSSQQTSQLAQLSSEALQQQIDEKLHASHLVLSVDTSPEMVPAQFQSAQSFRRDGCEAQPTSEVASDLSWLLLLTCYSRHESLLIDDIQTYPIAPQARQNLVRLGIRSLMAVPVEIADDVLGVICTTVSSPIRETEFEASRERGHTFAAAELELVEAIADMTAVAVQRTQFSEQARMRDALTAAMRGLSEGREAESRRLAADLHDQSIADLGAMSRQMQQLASQAQPDPMQQQQAIAAWSQQLRETITELRGIVEDLQPTAMRAFNLGSALRSLLERAAQRSTRPLLARFDDRTRGELNALEPLAQSTLFRIVQEALNNVVKHAEATRVDCTLSVTEDGYLEVKVIDDGKGMPANPSREGSHGLLNMRYRADIIGGTIEWKARRNGSGTVARLRVPLPEAEIVRHSASL
ncbi:GAF domain-containing protein [Synechococcus sp. PCC 7336]|uniref:GAF domain-containing protein n=1 Tax=Synechococcus sp. PCC 7336 TaxID=195250 RepID=UPI000349B513|nr:GAF domain-containing protein [Synechococcus sp. PCC 7336]